MQLEDMWTFLPQAETIVGDRGDIKRRVLISLIDQAGLAVSRVDYD